MSKQNNETDREMSINFWYLTVFFFFLEHPPPLAKMVRSSITTGHLSILVTEYITGLESQNTDCMDGLQSS